MKIGQSSGGCITGWNEADHFTPKAYEPILIHMKAWKPNEWGIGSYLEEENAILLLGGEPIEYSEIDFWMHVPRIPDTVIPYIIGDNYSEEESPLSNLAKRLYEGMTREEIEADIRKQIELVRKIRKEVIE